MYALSPSLWRNRLQAEPVPLGLWFVPRAAPANTPTGHQRVDHFGLLLGLERLRDVHGRRQLRR